MITAQVLRAAVGCLATLADLYAPLLDEVCERFEINTTRRLAHFLAQIGHESMSFKCTSEIWGPTPQQARYEGRHDLGNTQPGDGSRFRGHGLIQTTGRDNHARARDGLRAAGYESVPDFEADPLALTQPEWAARSAGLFWHDHKCNAAADRDDIIAVTKIVNGGKNGLEDRTARLKRAYQFLPYVDAMVPADPVAPIAAPPVPAAPLPVPDIPPPPAQPTKSENPMVIAGTFLWGLAQSLIGAFAPLAQEKISKEIARHTNNPEVAEQVASGVVNMAKTLTGQDDPIAAVAAAKTDPSMVQQIEASALDTIDRLAPMLDKIAAWDKQAWDAEEASRAAASARAAGDHNDQDAFLTRSIVWIVIGLLLATAVLIGVLSWLKFDSGVTALVSLFTTISGLAVGKFGTRYDHRYGSSRSSSGKDIVIGELSRRPSKQ